MIERDIRMIIALMTLRFGQEAKQVAAARAHAFAAAGDQTGAAVWSMVMRGIDALEMSTTNGTVH